MTMHHRIAKVRGGNNTPSNISLVPDKKHKAFNLLFTGSPTPYYIAKVLNETWIDPRYELVVRRRINTDKLFFDNGGES